MIKLYCQDWVFVMSYCIKKNDILHTTYHKNLIFKIKLITIKVASNDVLLKFSKL